MIDDSKGQFMKRFSLFWTVFCLLLPFSKASASPVDSLLPLWLWSVSCR